VALILLTVRFNQGEGQTENAIVTSTGPFVIAWDFAKLKKGYNDMYEIKKYEDHVVQDNFKFGDDKEIVSAILADVFTLISALAVPLGRCIEQQCTGGEQEESETANAAVPRGANGTQPVEYRQYPVLKSVIIVVVVHSPPPFSLLIYSMPLSLQRTLLVPLVSISEWLCETANWYSLCLRSCLIDLDTVGEATKS
jgi:hypothetical protein